MVEELRVARPAFSVCVRRYAAGEVMPRHGHDSGGLSFVMAGSLIEDVGHVRVRATVGSAVLKPRATMHANTFGEQGARLLSLTFDDCPELETLTGRTWQWSRHLDNVRTAARIIDLIKNDTNDARSERHGELLDEAGCELLCQPLEPARPPRPVPRWLKDVRAYLDEAHADGMTITELASAVPVHPVYLARRFRGAFGCSVSQYRRRARVLASLAAIASPGRTLADVAASKGFSDQSHLSRECRAAVGSTPSRLRTLLCWPSR